VNCARGGGRGTRCGERFCGCPGRGMEGFPITQLTMIPVSCKAVAAIDLRCDESHSWG
jgi:hypothetical protein